jgi:hypothetical protein
MSLNLMIYSLLRFISPSYALTLMMLEGRFSVESQVGLFVVFANNSAKLAKVNFWGITDLAKILDKLLVESSFMAQKRANLLHHM